MLRIGGKEPETYARDTVFIPRGEAPPLRFEIEALPLGEEQAQWDLFPHPRAPDDYVYGKDGKIPMRDPKTDKVLHAPNELDPEYLKRVTLAAKRRAAFVFRRATRNDVQVTFDADRSPGAPGSLEDKTGWELYADAIFADLQAAKLTYGEIHRVNERAIKIGSPTEEQCVEARNRFLRTGEDGTSPNLPLTEPAGASAT